MKLAGIAGVAFVIVTAAVAVGLTRAPDGMLLELAQKAAWTPFDVLSSALSALGGVIVTGVVASGITALGFRRYGVAAAAPVAALLAAIGIEYVLKRVIAQPAPPMELLRDFHWLAVGDPSAGGNAYPSGHLSRTTVIAIVVCLHRPALKWSAAMFVALMAVSRVYSASHWTSDVVGGLCLGVVLGFVASATQRSVHR